MLKIPLGIFCALLCYSATAQTNAIVTSTMTYSTNGTDWISTNIYQEPITNYDNCFYRSVTMVIPLSGGTTDLSSAVFRGTNVTDINTMVYSGYFIVNSSNVNVSAWMTIEGVAHGNPGGDTCQSSEVEIINNPAPAPPTVNIICLDGVSVFDFGCG